MNISIESSGASVSIDVGGTFTDCYLSLNGKASWGKAATTPDDFSRGFLNALAEASRGLNIEVTELLAGASLFRYSTTIALNALLQRAGPRLRHGAAVGRWHHPPGRNPPGAGSRLCRLPQRAG